ncbi:FAD/NAD(P)-binding protein [Argonema antarcticum]|uniref:FAD/NAD(P)-binding protein n=1 Tax=Argonema antarcticum TaxID=2942763 RepID=UPI002013887D|nr:FAD/NAD(P)-binding protein [Argonema antarcticum]MCL1474113.1 FAD/NAD(P)-binding protein [Argonema antarcticum A004/B2]
MTKNNLPIAIAIIGGGFSGSIVAAHLLRNATFPLNIKLIERRPTFGRGVAYGTKYGCHLLNVPAAKMSAFPDDPEHFLRWVQKEAQSRGNLMLSIVKPDTFVPRKIYGEYIQAVLDEAEAAAKENVQLERIKNEAVSISPDANGATVSLSTGQTLRAEKVVLALGNFPPTDPAIQDRSFYTSLRYVSYPWSPHALTDIDPKDAVLLIGSGLTMLDLAVALKEQGHAGAIHVVSRHGLLPYPHKFTTPYPAFLSVEGAPKTIRSLVRLVREEVKNAIARGYDWRAVLDSLRPLTQQLWQQLPLEEQRRFLRHVRIYWEVHRHRVSPGVADIVADMLHSEQMVVHAGRIQAYDEDDEAVDVAIRKRHTTDLEVVRVARVINSTGTECDYRKFGHPLIQNLRSHGFIRSDALAIGLDVSPNGALLDVDGVVSQILYTLGPPRQGRLWETTAVPEIRVQAQELARELLRSRNYS